MREWGSGLGFLPPHFRTFATTLSQASYVGFEEGIPRTSVTGRRGKGESTKRKQTKFPPRSFFLPRLLRSNSFCSSSISSCISHAWPSFASFLSSFPSGHRGLLIQKATSLKERERTNVPWEMCQKGTPPLPHPSRGGACLCIHIWTAK